MTEENRTHLKFKAASHPGRTGKQNEDRYRVAAFRTGPDRKTPSVLAVLCDGIGGHRAGEVAAEMGVSILTEELTASDGRQPLAAMQKAVARASNEIFRASLTEKGRKGMGTTCACAWVIGDRLFTANLGDSRIYLLREGHLIQLSTDHTWLQEAYDAGMLTEDEAVDHPNAHIIRRYLGSQQTPKPDFRMWLFEGESEADALDNQGAKLLPGDILLLCSDGLTDLVQDDEIRGVIQTKSLEDAPQVLIDMANQRGGHDNVTLVLMQMPPAEAQRAVADLKKRRRRLGCLAILLLVFVLLVYVYLRNGAAFRNLTEVSPSPQASWTAPFAATETQPPPSPEPSMTLPAENAKTVSATSAVETSTPWPTNTVVE